MKSSRRAWLVAARASALGLVLWLASGCDGEPAARGDAAPESTESVGVDQDAAAMQTAEVDGTTPALTDAGGPPAEDAGVLVDSAATDASAERDAQAQQDAASALDPDAASVPCNTLPEPRNGTQLRLVSDAQGPPRQSGGTVRDGSYRLDEAVVYVGSEQGVGVPEARDETLVVHGDVWQRVAYWDNQPTSRFTQRAFLRDETFHLARTCGHVFDTRVFSVLDGDEGTYTANGQRLVLQAQGAGERGLQYVLTYVRVSD